MVKIKEFLEIEVTKPKYDCRSSLSTSLRCDCRLTGELVCLHKYGTPKQQDFLNIELPSSPVSEFSRVPGSKYAVTFFTKSICGERIDISYNKIFSSYYEAIMAICEWALISPHNTATIEEKFPEGEYYEKETFA